MEKQLLPTAEQQLNRFSRQYLQLHLEIDYPDQEHLRNDVFQQELYTRMFKVEYAPPVRYQLRILKELTRRIEQSIQDWEEEGISDDLMNELSSLLVAPVPTEANSVQEKSYVTYTISALNPTSKSPATVTLLESRNLLTAGGVTGFRTWEAALHLGNYLCINPALVEGKHVLELGAGTSYLSILCAKYLHSTHYLTTDGSEDVVSSFSTNIYLNGLQDSASVEGKQLLWGHALVGSEHPVWNAGRPIDIVLGTDLTYDATLNMALIATLNDLFELYPKVKVLFGSTIRNESTFGIFKERCRKNGLAMQSIDYPVIKSELQEGPFYPDAAPVDICIISKP